MKEKFTLVSILPLGSFLDTVLLTKSQNFGIKRCTCLRSHHQGCRKWLLKTDCGEK